MFLNNPFPYSNSKRDHFIIAFLIGLLISFIINFLQPFGAVLDGFRFSRLYFSSYGLIFFFTYLVIYFLSSLYYSKHKSWKWAEELVFVLFFNSFSIVIAYFYTELVINTNPSRINLNNFLNWFFIIFKGFGVLIGITTIILQKHFALNKKSSVVVTQTAESFEEQKEKILFKGSLKNDFLKIKINRIIYIRPEENYIIIHYLENQVTKSKMLRCTLYNAHKQLPTMIKVHRSFLVNPNFILELKGNSQNARLKLERIDSAIPVSKTYYNYLKAHIY